MIRNGRRRAYWLIAVMGLAISPLRADALSEDDINAALGITPTATMSADDIATATQESIENATRVAESGGGIDSAANDTTDLAALGNPLIGRTGFLSNCTGCHVANGSGSALPVPGENGIAAPLTDMQIYNDSRRRESRRGCRRAGRAPISPTSRSYDTIAFIRSQP
ncbi:MAG: hypothetical protein R2843_14115 [Thermomicrobiales bacterium]